MAADNVQHGSVKPTSAPVSAPLTEEQKRVRFAEIRKRLSTSRISVTKIPPGKTPYWARKNDEGELSRLEYTGFVIVHDDPKNPQWEAAGRQPDGTYVIGDVILMEIDTDVYQYLEEMNREKSKNLIKSASQQFQEEAEKAQVPVFARSK
jgi:hypothetical protein